MSKTIKVVLIISIGLVLVLLAGYFLTKSEPKGISQVVSKPVTTHSKNTNKVSLASQDVAHIFIIMDENQPATNIVGNPQAPYLNSLIKSYALASNYSAITHPSLPNYLAITSGSTDGVTTDCNPPSADCIVNVANIADQVQSSGRTWMEYAESMPKACYAYNSGNYATKHNPFVYYADIIENPARCDAHVVPYSNLSVDLRAISTTPNFAFITPNLCNDMHNCSIATGDSWLASNVPMILNSAAFTKQKSLLIITWDEGYSTDNKVAAILAGSAVKSHFTSNVAYNHYSVLHTIEYLWGLKPLTTNVDQAPLMTEFLKN